MNIPKSQLNLEGVINSSSEQYINPNNRQVHTHLVNGTNATVRQSSESSVSGVKRIVPLYVKGLERQQLKDDRQPNSHRLNEARPASSRK